jgi:hypothetical protein
MNPVNSKSDFVRRYLEGEFGNAAPSWNSLAEWWQEEPVPWIRYGRNFHVRNRVVGGPTYYNLDAGILSQFWPDICRECGEHNLYISAMAPTHLTLIQGEVQRGIWGLDLTYSTVRLPMRDSLRAGATYTNSLKAQVLLQYYMNQQSYEWLQYLLENYDNHVIEFSVYDCEWGTVPGQNAVWWEVRKY